MVAANRQKNIYDDRLGTHGPAAFADFLIITQFIAEVLSQISHWLLCVTKSFPRRL
jgi:hypothetical protein